MQVSRVTSTSSLIEGPFTHPGLYHDAFKGQRQLKHLPNGEAPTKAQRSLLRADDPANRHCSD